MAKFHKYIYDLDNRKIKGDFEGAYKSASEIWNQQNNMEAPHFSYLRGLVLQKSRLVKKDLDILDIGCGYGTFVNDLNELNIGTVIGYDISETAIKAGQKKYGSKVDLRVGSLNDINSFNNEFDYVFLLGVLWFLLNDVDGALMKIKNFLKPSGEFIITLNVPENPIGKEIISGYDDLINLISKYFSIVDVFNWYQPEAISTKNYSKNMTDMLIRAKLK